MVCMHRTVIFFFAATALPQDCFVAVGAVFGWRHFASASSAQHRVFIDWVAIKCLAYANIVRACGLTVTVNLKLVRMSLHLFLIVTSVTPDRLDTSR